jgi:hypothetical protein
LNAPRHTVRLATAPTIFNCRNLLTPSSM